MIKHLNVIACVSLLAASPLLAQTPTTPINAPAGTILSVGGTGVAVLRTGTPVPLKLTDMLTTKNKVARVGQRFHMEVAENVLVDGQVVIPTGSPAMGEITDVRNKGMWGKSGHLAAQVLYVTVNGRQIRLSGTFDDKGVTGTAGVVAAVALIPVAGFFTTGTSAKLPAGAVVKGYVDEDVPLAFASTPAQAPLVVTPTATNSSSSIAAVSPHR